LLVLPESGIFFVYAIKEMHHTRLTKLFQHDIAPTKKFHFLTSQAKDESNKRNAMYFSFVFLRLLKETFTKNWVRSSADDVQF
tara:strand:+ start:1798 stop:2046 length:249 start_codon:yes stop_codon:yes gene_type:complete